MIKKIITFLFLFSTFCTLAQTADGPQMADSMREDGKIYVVISVIGIVFISIVIFLIILERKLKKLEDKLK